MFDILIGFREIPGSDGDKVGVISRGRNGDTSSAPEMFALV